MATLTQEPPVREQETLRRDYRNVGGYERGARAALGVAAGIAAFAVGATWLRVLLGIVGVSGLVTSATSYCPANTAIGRDSFHHSGIPE